MFSSLCSLAALFPLHWLCFPVYLFNSRIEAPGTGKAIPGSDVWRSQRTAPRPASHRERPRELVSIGACFQWRNAPGKSPWGRWPGRKKPA